MKNLKKRILKKYKIIYNNKPILQNLEKVNRIKTNYDSYSPKENPSLIQKKIFEIPKKNNKNDIIIQSTINNKENKKVTIELPDKSIYIGTIKNNKFEGEGEYTTKNYKYCGEFSSGKKQGKGKLNDFENKIEYEGEFRNNMKEGKGIEKYSDGSVYKGEFKENWKHGRGILLLQENSNYGYEGEFKYDQKSGKGKFKWSEIKEYIGEWSDDEINGYGILKEDKIIHIGFFSNNTKHGLGATFYTDQNFVLLGNWEYDITNGFSILINLSKIKNNVHLLNNNINFDKKNEIIIQIHKGEIIKKNLDGEDLFNFKNSPEYEKMIKKYNELFFCDYQKYIKKNYI